LILSIKKNNFGFTFSNEIYYLSVMKQLYFGDCLDVLKELSAKHPNGFIDLIYIDPPFNSKRNYNILFEDLDMTDTKAQREAFADTWSRVSYKDTLNELLELHKDLYNFLKTLDSINISKSAVSYLTTMAIRIYYMHKVLKDTGSFYLHCDSSMSHFLKLICDLIFGDKNKGFKNEIVWKRTSAHNDPKKFGRNTDRILFYTKSEKYTFNTVFLNYDDSYLTKFYRYYDEKGVYRLSDLTGPGINPNDEEWRGYHPANVKRHWSVPKRYLIKVLGKEKFEKMTTKQKLDYLYEQGLIHFTQQGTPSFKRYLETMGGVPAQELWTDIPPISPQAKERLGYPTQKPEALLERIIKASSNEGDLVADFFCGCGTTIAVANRLNRNWLGVDISHLAIRLILQRLTDPYDDDMKRRIRSEIEIHGFPRDVASAKELARKGQGGRLEFQEWVVEVLLHGINNPKRTADGGWDGYITFRKNGNEKGVILIEVKSGNVSVKDIREFKQVVDSEQADMGVFVCFADELSKPMLEAAKDAGRYRNYQFDRIQIITIEELLQGKEIKMPGGVDPTTFKKAVKDIRPEKPSKPKEMF
jgi:site-specific DNA-methyltransferase (adenine-specific)